MTRSDGGDGAIPHARLSVLGATELRQGDESVSSVLAQPKRLALLAYLVLARPGSFQRRDRLLALFWPTSTEDRARANLRQAVRFLRKALGDAVIVGRGDGEIGIAEGVLSCDALEFRRALDGGGFERALKLYGGELLPGLFVSGAPDFERWLSAERRAAKEAARDAAKALAASAESEGRLQSAVDRAGRAVSLDPLDEDSSRRLMRLLDRAGRRAEAVRVYESLRTRLATELELAPSAETEALVAEFRHGEAFGTMGSPHGAASSLDPRRVLVLPYRNRTGLAEYDAVGALAADWIAQGLARNPELSVVPPAVSRGAGAESGPTGDDPHARLPEIAGDFGAGTVVSGTVEIRDSDVVFRSSILDTVANRLLPPPDPVSVPVADATDALGALRKAVAGCLAPVLSTQAVHARHADRPPSFEAYRAYLDGLDDFIDGRWEEALAGFRAAMREEPEYALPRVVSAIALWNLGRLREALVVAREAEELRDALGPFERGALDMVLGWLRGDWRAAYAGARRQADLAPGSLAACQVAEEARRLNRPREALDLLTALDPSQGELRGWIFYWVELCTAHHMLGDHRSELDAARRALSLHPGHGLVILAQVRALAALGEFETVQELAYRILATPPGGSPSPGALLRRAALELSAHGRAPEGRRVLEMSAEWWGERGTPPDPVGRREMALTLYHLGRLEEARAILLDLVGAPDRGLPALDEHHGTLRGHLDEGVLALIADRLQDKDEAARWRRLLEDRDEPLDYGAKWLWLAALATRTGEVDRGVSLLRRAFIEGLPFSPSLHTLPDLAPLRSHPGFRGILAPKG